MARKPTYEELEKKVKELEQEAAKKKQTDLDLKESEERYRAIVDAFDGLIYVCSQDYRVEFMNDKFIERTGYYPKDELCYKALHELDSICPWCVNEQVFKGETVRWEVKSPKDDRWYYVVNTPIYHVDGSISKQAMIIDITERKQSGEELRKSEEKYRDLYDNAPDMYVSVDANTATILDCNQTLVDVLGYTKEEIIGRSIFDLYASTSAEYAKENVFPKFLQTGTIVEEELQLQRKDGSKIDVSLNVSAVRDEEGNIKYSRSSFRDITERKSAEKALRESEETLRESEEKYRTLFNNAADLIAIIDANGNFLELNDKFEEESGYKKNEMIRKNIFTSGILTESSVEKTIFFLEKMLKGESWPIFEIDGVKKGGETIPYELSAVPIKKGSKIIAIQAILRNLTERKKGEEALRESEEKYRTAMEASPDPLVVYDKEGRVVYFNPAFTQVFGWSLDERLGKKMDLFVPEDAWPETKMMIEKVLAGEKFLGVETRRYTKDGRILPVSISGATYRDQDGNLMGSVINLRDISEQKKLEGQLQQAQKMEAIGTLAGGIAHDFNNLLMGIQGRASLMLVDIDSYHPYYGHLKGIEDYVRSASDLTQQLLAFARGGKYEVKPTDLNQLLDKSSDMFGRTKKEISIHRKSQKNIWTVEVDRGQIEQVLLNLFVNAWQSMPGGGELYLETENVMLDADYVRPYSIESGKYVKISVTDTGVGMDKATQERIFDPFFTTKEMGRGTGLGLASAYGIIKNHNGFTNVYSEKGKGATFNLYLPASEKEVVDEKKLSEKVLKGRETVMLVDDEDMIIEVGKELLNKMGYKVLTAKGGREAVELYEGNKDEIDIVILDMIMPEISGGDTYDKLKEINPDIRVLLSSGYSINGQAQDILNRGCNGFIQKPFSLIDLSQKIRGILDKE